MFVQKEFPNFFTFSIYNTLINYFIKRISKTVLFFIVIFLISCQYRKEKIEVGYIFHETTGHTEYLLINSNEVPIKFDSKSNKIALNSLYSLNPSILYPNSDGTKIFVIGHFLQGNKIFMLEHWYIKAPFKEYIVVDETELPHKIEIFERHELSISDFRESSFFNPNKSNLILKNFIK